MGHDNIGTEHVLLALLELEDETGVLAGLGIDKPTTETGIVAAPSIAVRARSSSGYFRSKRASMRSAFMWYSQRYCRSAEENPAAGVLRSAMMRHVPLARLTYCTCLLEHALHYVDDGF